MKPTIIDMFCGAGGMGLGFKKAGFEIAQSFDFDKYAVQSYRHNVDSNVRQLDIRHVQPNDLQQADVWTFGFPCQDLSVAGQRKGLTGERSSLFFEVMRLLQNTPHNQKPKVILAENVKGLRKYLPVLEQEYEKQGYTCRYTMYNSKYWGVPQNRERYFIVGIRKDLPINFTFPVQNTDYIPKLSSVLEKNVDEKYYMSDEKSKAVIQQALERLDQLEEDQHGLIMLGLLDMKGHESIRRVYDPQGISPTITASEGGHRQPKILAIGNTNPSGRGMNGQVYHTEGLAPTCTTNKGEGHKIMHEFRVRKLTPREYARLQGFPESFEFHVSNSQLYKQFGNAVTVNVAQAIAEQIKEALSHAIPIRV